MKKSSTAVAKQSRNISQQRLTIGLDLGDRNSWYCVVDEAGRIQQEQRVRTRAKALREVFRGMPRVLLWLANAVKGTFEDGARQFPRGTIANSIWNTVTHSMKGESDTVIERAILQARQEADVLYNLAITVNERVLTTTSQRYREYLFLIQCLRGVTYINVGPHSEEELRLIVSFFVEEVLLLDGATSQVSAEHFGGNPILFSDSALKLKEQLDLAHRALGHFNAIGQKLGFKELTAESVRETLRPNVAQQASVWKSLARIGMLSEFGDAADCRAAYSQFIDQFYDPRTGYLKKPPLTAP